VGHRDLVGARRQAGDDEVAVSAADSAALLDAARADGDVDAGQGRAVGVDDGAAQVGGEDGSRQQAEGGTQRP
jgi:hypothetical protein